MHKLTYIAVIAGGLAEHHPNTQPLAGQISELVRSVMNRRISRSWREPAGNWAPPDHDRGINALHRSAQAVMLLRPEWPETADLVRLTQGLLNSRLRT